MNVLLIDSIVLEHYESGALKQHEVIHYTYTYIFIYLNIFFYYKFTITSGSLSQLIRPPFELNNLFSFVLFHTFFSLITFYNSINNIQAKYINLVFYTPVSGIDCCFSLK